ncbi:hypothetical protein NXZ84_02115 [Mechercharimyces sp. CAU 1602]|nr:hypothetical protein [Mechercharimyces sp. CAU 1602]
MDLHKAYWKAGLTERQKEALYYVYVRDLRQVDTAFEMRITQQAVADHIIGALKRIAKVYEVWSEETGKEETEACYVCGKYLLSGEERSGMCIECERREATSDK